MAPGTTGDEVLRAKYLDWCSARLAERFIELTPDEIYELAERATRDEGSAGVAASSDALVGAVARAVVGPRSGEAAVSFRALVERVTEALRRELDLPGYEAWAAAYRAAPERYDDELLGLWRERTEGKA